MDIMDIVEELIESLTFVIKANYLVREVLEAQNKRIANLEYELEMVKSALSRMDKGR